MKWVVTHAAGYGGAEVLVPQFGDAYLVSVHQLLEGANTLLGLGMELGEASKPQDKSFVDPVKHRIGLLKPASKMQAGLGSTASLHQEESAPGAGMMWGGTGRGNWWQWSKQPGSEPWSTQARVCGSLSDRVRLAA